MLDARCTLSFSHRDNIPIDPESFFSLKDFIESACDLLELNCTLNLHDPLGCEAQVIFSSKMREMNILQEALREAYPHLIFEVTAG